MVISSALFGIAPCIGATKPAAVLVMFNDRFEGPANMQGRQVYQNFGTNWATTAGAGIEVRTDGVLDIDTPYGDQYVELDSDPSRGGTDAPTNSP
jgi:hypothetical protein